MARDDRCDVGRWLHGTTPGDRAYHATSTTPHADFHRAAAAPLHVVSAGQKAQALAAMGPDGAFTKASRELTKAMTAWQASTQ